MNFINKLSAAWTANNSLLCVGLDPDVATLEHDVVGAGGELGLRLGCLLHGPHYSSTMSPPFGTTASTASLFSTAAAKDAAESASPWVTKTRFRPSRSGQSHWRSFGRSACAEYDVHPPGCRMPGGSC